VRRVALLLMWVSTLLTSTLGGCFFNPDLHGNGYTECLADDDCPLDRMCRSGYCTPPPWNDIDYKSRTPIFATNHTDVEAPAGTVVDLAVGGDNAFLTSEQVGPEGRLTTYDRDFDVWDVVELFNDPFNDRLVWRLPLLEPLPAGESTLLAWLETDNPGETFTRLEVPSVYSTFFDNFEVTEDDPIVAFDDEVYRAFGGEPLVQGGVMNIADNQKVILRQPLTPPFSVTLKGRFNQTVCSRVFLGVMGDDAVGYAAPSAGFFLQDDLMGITEVAPQETSTPLAVTEERRFDNVVRRYRIDVGQGAVRSLIDYEVLYEGFDLAPPMADDAEYTVVIDVDGNNCSFDLDELWIHPTTLPAPTPSLGETVEYVQLEQ